MIKYIIENSYSGLLTAVFNKYKDNDSEIEIISNISNYSFLDSIKSIKCDTQKALRVDNKLKTILKPINYKGIKTALKSGCEDKYTIIFNYICEVINVESDVTDNFNNSNVFKYNELLSKIKLEVHRFTGFIRFNLLKNDIYYAKFNPDNDICELLLPHFIKRFPLMKFVLHDENHNVLSAYDGKHSKTVKAYFKLNQKLDSLGKLFKTYCESVSIKERKNLKLMKNYMPKRYHINAPEKDELL